MDDCRCAEQHNGEAQHTARFRGCGRSLLAPSAAGGGSFIRTFAGHARSISSLPDDLLRAP
jgi:hypothetical protein